MILRRVAPLLSLFAVFVLSLGAVAQDCSMNGAWVGKYSGDRSGDLSASFTESGTSFKGTIDGYSFEGTNSGVKVSFDRVTVGHTTVTISGTFSTSCSTLTGPWKAVNTEQGTTHTGSFTISTASATITDTTTTMNGVITAQFNAKSGMVGDVDLHIVGSEQTDFKEYSSLGSGSHNLQLDFSIPPDTY